MNINTVNPCYSLASSLLIKGCGGVSLIITQLLVAVSERRNRMLYELHPKDGEVHAVKEWSDLHEFYLHLFMNCFHR